MSHFGQPRPAAPVNVSSPKASIVERLQALDLSLFDYVRSQSYPADRVSLLALHAACRSRYGRFSYLEIGSFLGGSLQALIADPDCVSIVSIDARSGQSPDDRRGLSKTYEANSTANMLDLLSRVPDADLSKLTTFDGDVSSVTAEQLPARPQLCFIDGEHTRAAALEDAKFCASVTGGEGCIVFHDRDRVRLGIGDFLEYLGTCHVPFVGYPAGQVLFVVEMGRAPLLALPAAGWGPRAERVLWRTASKLPSRTLAVRFLLWVWHAPFSTPGAAKRGRRLNGAARRRARRSIRRARGSGRRARKLLRGRRRKVQARLGSLAGGLGIRR